MKPWMLGLLILLMFVVLGELSVVFGDYVFHRLSIDRSTLLWILWLMPLVAAYVAARYSMTHKLLAGLSYLILLPLIGAVAHYINGEFGGTVDFTGLQGAVTTFKIYLGVGSIVVLVGTFLGIALSKNGSPPRNSGGS
ncbi:MAG: hypothetical protein KZQ89_21675 [Candidatus Thiodiazotropha sp. (ex Lucinoma kastoroae)]|nr:hypothetical protein [Candidatus Thiodiazotropha sp. (ex Lucinoma kastoroae)]